MNIGKWQIIHMLWVCDAIWACVFSVHYEFGSHLRYPPMRTTSNRWGFCARGLRRKIVGQVSWENGGTCAGTICSVLTKGSKMDISQRLGWLQLELLGSWDPNAATCKENSRKLVLATFRKLYLMCLLGYLFSAAETRDFCVQISKSCQVRLRQPRRLATNWPGFGRAFQQDSSTVVTPEKIEMWFNSFIYIYTTMTMLVGFYVYIFFRVL